MTISIVAKNKEEKPNLNDKLDCWKAGVWFYRVNWTPAKKVRTVDWMLQKPF